MRNVEGRAARWAAQSIKEGGEREEVKDARRLLGWREHAVAHFCVILE